MNAYIAVSQSQELLCCVPWQHSASFCLKQRTIKSASGVTLSDDFAAADWATAHAHLKCRSLTLAAGIAWDEAKRELYVTGKYWSKLYEIKPMLQTATPTRADLTSVRNRCIS